DRLLHVPLVIVGDRAGFELRACPAANAFHVSEKPPGLVRFTLAANGLGRGHLLRLALVLRRCGVRRALDVRAPNELAHIPVISARGLVVSLSLQLAGYPGLRENYIGLRLFRRLFAFHSQSPSRVPSPALAQAVRAGGRAFVVA